jgi:hypothetical protein
MTSIRQPYSTEQLLKPTMISDPASAFKPQVAPGTPSMAPSPTTVTRTATPVQTPQTGSTAVSMRPGGSTITSQSPVAGAPGTPFTDIRSRMFMPGQSAGTSQVQGYTNQLAGQLAGQQFQPFQGIEGGSYNPSDEAQQLRQRIMEQLENTGRLDRGGLAMQAFDLMRTRSDPAFQQSLRQVGQKNAALGRLGSGMVTSDLMDVTAQRERDLGYAQRDMALEAAGLSLQDRLAQLNASQGVFGQFTGDDRANAGFQMDLRNERRGERQAGLNYGLDTFGARHGLLNSMGGLEQQRFGQDMAGRNEMRDERAWQQGMNQTAMDNALRERLTQEQIFGNDYDRWLRGTATFGGLGYGDTGSNQALAGAGQYQQQAQDGMNNLGQLGQGWSYNEWLRKNGGIVN